jgi:hypothetical protein
MDLRFHITESEVVSAGLLRMRWLRDAALIVAIISAAVFVIAVGFNHWRIDAAFVEGYLILAVAIGIGIAAIIAVRMRFIVIPRRARRTVRYFPWLYQDASATLDEDGFVLRSPHLQINWQWAELDGFRENAAVFLLCPPRSGYIVPKQRFSADEFAALDALIRRKLKKLN